MLVSEAGVDAGPPDEQVAAQRDQQSDTGELDRGAARLARVREDGEILQRGANDAADDAPRPALRRR